MVQMLTAGTAAGCEGRKGASSDGRAERKREQFARVAVCV